MAITTLNLRGLNRSDTATTGQVVTATSAVAADFQDAAGGAWTFIKSQTASSSSSIDFVHGTSDVVFDGTYIAYQLHGIYVDNATDNESVTLLLSTDAGSSYITSGYDTRQFRYVESTTSHMSNQTSEAMRIDSTGTAAGCHANFIVDFWKPNQTASMTQIYYRGTYRNNSAQAATFSGSSIYEAAGDIDAFRIIPTSGNIEAGQFLLYGLSGS